ncbi:MAG: M48 family metallopeptidase [Synechococcales cyanobacterium C42_A2020_086]|jgi:predicted metal-dependent hydrolase|nr:M48 family metallopeptidase [Synechococcales cyanobacterium M58_A2018_015]MBF2073572.1 M48 family metallopeptidase [Synechococcales cyanobacterium C42_A2020_086]
MTGMVKAKTSKPKSYRVRESARAKHVSIKVSHLGDVEVVVPTGFDQNQIPDILRKRQDWIARTIERIAAERQSLLVDKCESASEQAFPKQIELRSILEAWNLRYEPSSRYKASVTAPHQLTLQGAMDAPRLYSLLHHWLKRKAEFHLVPWLRQISQEIELSFNQAHIRGQKTLWASCSAKKNISLNYKLLFLPRHLVRYVLIHELCHTVHLNHSARFWDLVAAKEPDYKALDRELGKAWIYVPEWVERSLNGP